MLNHRALAAAIVATGAGAVVFLSSGQDIAAPATPGAGPVPVAIPPSVTEIPSVDPVVPAAKRVLPPSTAAPAPSVQPTPKRASTATTPTAKTPAKPKRTVTPRAAAPSTQQPQPADTEPNGTGGWQLPACYEESCVAPWSAHSEAAAFDPGPLDLLGIVIPGLLVGR